MSDGNPHGERLQSDNMVGPFIEFTLEDVQQLTKCVGERMCLRRLLS